MHEIACRVSLHPVVCVGVEYREIEPLADP